MRMKRWSNLPIDEQVKKLKGEIKFSYIFAPVFEVFMVILAVILIVYTAAKGLGIAFMSMVPISIGFGVLQIVEDKKQIKKLEAQKAEQEKKTESEEQVT